MAICQAIKDGRLNSAKIDDSKNVYLAWAEQKEIWEELQSLDKPGQPSKKAREEMEYVPDLPILDYEGKNLVLESLGSSVSSENVSSEELDDEEVKEVSDIAFSNADLNLKDIDESTLSDCWIRDRNGNYLMDPVKKKPMIDWKKADMKIKALIHNQQLATKAGELISLVEAQEMLSMAYSPVAEAITNIPDKFFTRFTDWAQGASGTVLSNKEKSEIKQILDDEINSILKELQFQLRGIL